MLIKKEEGVIPMTGTGYYLKVIQGIDSGKAYDLNDGAITIGRSNENIIQLNENELFVSNHHAILYKYNSMFHIQDIASRNGLYLNGVRTIQNEVFLNDIIGFGERGPKLKLLSINNSKQEEDLSGQIPSILPDKYLCVKYISTPPEILNQNFNTTKTKQDNLPKKCSTPEIAHKNSNNLSNKFTFIGKAILKEKPYKVLVKFFHNAIIDHLENRNYLFWGLMMFILFLFSAISFFTFRLFQHNGRFNMTIDLNKKFNNYEKQMNSLEMHDSSFYRVTPVFGCLNNQNFDTSLFHRFNHDTVELFLKAILTSFGDTDNYIPPQMTEIVKNHLKAFSTTLKPTVCRFFKKKELYFPMIQKIFLEKNVPIQLAYISMLESGFNPLALSPSGARGLWQFMPQTARKYGLKIDSISDERTQPQKSTYAAAEYLRDLIGIFGGNNSIMLAIAAYNAGENRIIDALRKIDDPIHDRDFWSIYSMRYLTNETNEYIPAILALMIIDQNRTYFKFTNQDIN